VTTPAAARQNQYGNRIYPVPKPGSLEVEELPSVSQILKVLASAGLEIWKLKTVAEQFALRHDLVMLAADPDTRYDAVQQALNASKPASNTGTAVHKFTEMVDDDTLDWNLVPEVAKPWVAHYAAAKAAYGWTLIEKEFTVYNHAWGFAGTSDRVLDVPGFGRVVADVKTGRSVYGDQALQLGMYAFGEGVWRPVPKADLTESAALEAALLKNIEDGTNIPPGRRKWSKDAIDEERNKIEEIRWREYCEKGKHEPMPAGLSQEVGIIIHLANDKCELVPLDLKGVGPVIEGLCAVYHWKERKNVVGQVLKPANEYKLTIPQGGMNFVNKPVVQTPDPARDQKVTSLKERIVALPQEARQELAFTWPSGVPTFKQSTNHTDAQLEAIEKAVWSIECSIAAPTPEGGEPAEASAVASLLSAFPGSAEDEPIQHTTR
jgi:hypothetical protein